MLHLLCTQSDNCPCLSPAGKKIRAYGTVRRYKHFQIPLTLYMNTIRSSESSRIKLAVLLSRTLKLKKCTLLQCLDANLIILTIAVASSRNERELKIESYQCDGKGLMTSLLSFVVSNCEFVTFPLESLVRCGTWLYRLPIFATLLTFIRICQDVMYQHRYILIYVHTYYICKHTF